MTDFATLKRNHYSSDLTGSNFKKAEDVYAEIGYDLSKLDDKYRNTCALRMSLALLKSRVPFQRPVSYLQIKSGPLKGRFVGTGAKTLADVLVRSSLGKPLTDAKARKAMRDHKGIVFFYAWPDYSTGGHIDLIEPTTAARILPAHLYFSTHPDPLDHLVDLVEPVPTKPGEEKKVSLVQAACNSYCEDNYLRSKEIWFWPM
jgi:hypothetical protein